MVGAMPSGSNTPPCPAHFATTGLTSQAPPNERTLSSEQLRSYRPAAQSSERRRSQHGAETADGASPTDRYCPPSAAHSCETQSTASPRLGDGFPNNSREAAGSECWRAGAAHHRPTHDQQPSRCSCRPPPNPRTGHEPDNRHIVQQPEQQPRLLEHESGPRGARSRLRSKTADRLRIGSSRADRRLSSQPAYWWQPKYAST